ncbi:MAG: hypothetical protein AB7G13_33710 [Lautropia sp.]
MYLATLIGIRFALAAALLLRSALVRCRLLMLRRLPVRRFIAFAGACTLPVLLRLVHRGRTPVRRAALLLLIRCH